MTFNNPSGKELVQAAASSAAHLSSRNRILAMRTESCGGSRLILRRDAQIDRRRDLPLTSFDINDMPSKQRRRCIDAAEKAREGELHESRFFEHVSRCGWLAGSLGAAVAAPKSLRGGDLRLFRPRASASRSSTAHKAKQDFGIDHKLVDTGNRAPDYEEQFANLAKSGSTT